MQEYSLVDFTSPSALDSIISDAWSKDSIEITISYVSDFKSAKILRELVDRICKSIGMNPKWRTRLVLIIDEMNNNAIEYGSNPQDINYFTFIVRKKSTTSLYIESYVCDSWNWPQAKTADQMGKLKSTHENKDFSTHNSIRGRGLFLIISQLVDTLYFKDNKYGWLTVGIQKLLEEDS